MSLVLASTTKSSVFSSTAIPALLHFLKAKTRLVTLMFPLPFHFDNAGLLIFLLLYLCYVFLTGSCSFSCLLSNDALLSFILCLWWFIYTLPNTISQRKLKHVNNFKIMTSKYISPDWSFRPIVSNTYELTPTNSSVNAKSSRVSPWIL